MCVCVCVSVVIVIITATVILQYDSIVAFAAAALVCRRSSCNCIHFTGFSVIVVVAVAVSAAAAVTAVVYGSDATRVALLALLLPLASSYNVKLGARRICCCCLCCCLYHCCFVNMLCTGN